MAMGAPREIFFCALCAMFIVALSQEGFTSIDCGGEAAYIDKNGISWQSDYGLITTGAIFRLKDSSLPKNLKILRCFPGKGSNCYTFNAAANRRHLIRASFYYGNYDGRSFWPSFDMEIDGVFWTKVSGSFSDENSGNYSVYEAIISPQGVTFSVCLTNSDQFNVPFISALEVRVLPAGKYSYGFGKRSLHLKFRHNFGAKTDLRYPDDEYDRIWHAKPDPPSRSTAVNLESKSRISWKESQNDAPVAVLETGFEGPDDLSAQKYTFDLGSKPSAYYIDLYFSDFRERKLNDICSFNAVIKVNGLVLRKKIEIAWSSATSYVVEVLEASKVSSGKLEIILLPSANSTLAPILSGLEVYKVGNSHPS